MFRLWSVTLLLGCALCATSAALALTFSVDTTTDSADISGGDGICATSDGHCSLRAALQEADASDGADTISLPRGIFKLTLGSLSISSDVLVSGAGAELTRLRGTRHSRVIEVTSAGRATLTALTVEGGFAPIGAAVLNSGTLTASDTRFVQNLARRTEGGLGGAIYNSGELRLTRVELQRNRAGGAVSSFGGALYNSGSAELRSVLLRRNWAGGCGGAIFNDGGNLSVSDATFERNAARNSGGGLFHQSGNASVERTLFARNRASKIGGGIFTYAVLLLRNTTLSSNRSGAGGGLFAAIAPAVELLNVTITGNRAAQGGGLLNNGTVLLRNSLIAGNRPLDCNGSAVDSLGHNLAGDASCGLSAAGDLNATDPMLSKLDDFGGDSWSHTLLAGSPARDAADASCPDEDQRNYSRPIDGNGDGVASCDIGAVEAAPLN